MSKVLEGGSGLQKVLAELYTKLTGKTLDLVSKDAPPTAEGMIRLLVGEAAGKPSPRGQVFTQSPESAVKYMHAGEADPTFDGKGAISYLDVPEDIAQKSKMKSKIASSPSPQKQFDKITGEGVSAEANLGQEHYIVPKLAGMKKQILPAMLGGAAIEAMSDPASAQGLESMSNEQLQGMLDELDQLDAEDAAERQMTKGRGPEQLPPGLQRGPAGGANSIGSAGTLANHPALNRTELAAGGQTASPGNALEDTLLDALGGVSGRDVGSSEGGKGIHAAARMAPFIASPSTGVAGMAGSDLLIGAEQGLAKNVGEGTMTGDDTLGMLLDALVNAGIGGAANATLGRVGQKLMKKSSDVAPPMNDPEHALDFEKAKKNLTRDATPVDYGRPPVHRMNTLNIEPGVVKTELGRNGQPLFRETAAQKLARENEVQRLGTTPSSVKPIKKRNEVYDTSLDWQGPVAKEDLALESTPGSSTKAATIPVEFIFDQAASKVPWGVKLKDPEVRAKMLKTAGITLAAGGGALTAYQAAQLLRRILESNGK